MGSDPIALPLLDCLHGEMGQQFALRGVFTQPDRPHGRGMKLQANAIKQWAQSNRVSVLQPESIGTEELDWLREQGVELILVMAYGHLLKRDLLALPKHPVLNFHASLLPRFRGASPINAAIAAGESETGVSLMQIVPALDAGPVFAVEKVPLSSSETPATLAQKLSMACVPLLRTHLPDVVGGTLQAVPQDKASATYCRILEKQDALLDFQEPAVALERRIRALSPWPGTAVDWQSTPDSEPIRLKIGHASALPYSPINAVQPGTLLPKSAFPTQEGLPVATGEGVLFFNSLQRPGGKMLGVDEFLRGFPLACGTVFRSEPMRPLYSADRKAMSRTAQIPAK